MKLMIISAIVAVAAMQSAHADVIPLGQRSSRIGYSEGKSSTVFTGDGTELDYKVIGLDKRDSRNGSLSESFGIGHKSQIDLGLIYTHVDAGVAGTVGGVAEVSGRLLYNAYANENFDVNVGFGVRAAGDNQGGAAFTSLNDGLTKYDYNLDLGYMFPMFKLGLNSRFTDRNSSVSKSQTLFELYGTLFPSSDVYVNLSYLAFNTSGGTDVLATGFAFNTVKEKYNAINVAVGYSYNPMMGIDVHYGKKLASNAANTDGNTTYGLGLTCNY